MLGTYKKYKCTKHIPDGDDLLMAISKRRPNPEYLVLHAVLSSKIQLRKSQIKHVHRSESLVTSDFALTRNTSEQEEAPRVPASQDCHSDLRFCLKWPMVSVVM